MLKRSCFYADTNTAQCATIEAIYATGIPITIYNFGLLYQCMTELNSGMNSLLFENDVCYINHSMLC